ncbi:MAG: CDP-alcohol phosphatidyltransferase family protein [Myxococcales bacterium]|nr:CDP-alcohol phosphatidyltransferase family protein [Myxococcales bacterium]
MTQHRLPPLRSLLKSTDVEDPVNVYVHRPLAYAFVWSIFRTPITPNMVTFLAMLFGLASGCMFVWGSAGAMVAGGAFLWISAILDGADGILARAKSLQSDFGRAIDGSADSIVAAFTVFPAFYHIWVTYHRPWDLVLMVPALVLTNVHLTVYDFYKEQYLRMTRPERSSTAEDPEKVAAMIDEAREKGLVAYLAVKVILHPYLVTQQRLMRWMNPAAMGFMDAAEAGDERTAAIWRRHNLGPMRLWTVVSLAPHSYLMAICAMADRLDVYLYIRVFFMNAVFVIALLWQRRATARAVEALALSAPFVATPGPAEADREAFATEP